MSAGRRWVGSVRIVALLLSTTEILFAIGAGDDVVGVTFECDFPPEARSRRIVFTSTLPAGLTPAQIDAEVRARITVGEDLQAQCSQRRRTDALDQRRSVLDMFGAKGMEAFSERARLEPWTNGKRAARRTVGRSMSELTDQEAQVAKLARDGPSNPRDRRPPLVGPRRRPALAAAG